MKRIFVPARTAAAIIASTTLLVGLAGTVPAAADTHVTATGDSTTTVGARWSVSRLVSRRTPASAPKPSYAVEQGLTANAIAVHRAGLSAWPQIVTYYGYRNDPSSDHYSGKALDLMIPKYTTSDGKALGQKVADWAVANQPRLNIQYVIWNQEIWNVSRASEGWRPMADRGSDSANHKNHVHISVK